MDFDKINHELTCVEKLYLSFSSRTASCFIHFTFYAVFILILRVEQNHNAALDGPGWTRSPGGTVQRDSVNYHYFSTFWQSFIFVLENFLKINWKKTFRKQKRKKSRMVTDSFFWLNTNDMNFEANIFICSCGDFCWRLFE